MSSRWPGLRTCTKWIVGAVAVACWLLPSAANTAGLRVLGADRATVVLPTGATVDDYANHGYRLQREEQYAWIEVQTAPLQSDFPFRAPPIADLEEPVARLAVRLATGARTRFEAVSNVLSWISANIEYRLDRTQSQQPQEVLTRRSGYCTGVARLTVALLQAIGIEAREVPGFVVRSKLGDGLSGYHRWIEVYYPDVGWVFSDPIQFHHYVPANYVRLAGEFLDAESAGRGGELVRREDRIEVVDLEGSVPGGVQVRPNSHERVASALRIETGDRQGEAFLERAGVLHRQPLDDRGGCDFVGLKPATYTVWVHWDDGTHTVREIVIDQLERIVLHLRKG